jgi:hypothetical protein
MLQQNRGPIKAAKYTHTQRQRCCYSRVECILTRYVLSWYAVVSTFPKPESYPRAFTAVLQRQTQGNAACGIELCHSSCQCALHCIGPHSSFRMPGYKCACTVCKCSALLPLVQGPTILCVCACL